jgi:hypothetical protein
LAVDGAGNLYIADFDNNVVRKVDTAGIITTVAGSGTSGYSGDGGPATAAQLHGPWGVAIGAAGNLFIADRVNHVVREVNAGGVISTAAGNGSFGYSGDGGPATAAQLAIPGGVALDATEDIIISDQDNSVVREVGAAAYTVAPAATTSAVVASGNPSIWGQSVTFTATVSVTSPGAGTPTGTVTFKDGSTTLGTGTLQLVGSLDQATFSTTGLSVGSHTITAAYNTDGNFLSSTSAGINQQVNQATPTITWANPSGITYGTALSATQLDATASVPGTFVYSPAAGTVLNAGSNQALSVTFTPTDTTDYTSATAQVAINVAKAHLAITADNQTKVYAAALPTLTATISGFQNGETLATSGVTGSPSLATTATASSHVEGSPYTITPAIGNLASSNYDFTSFVNGTLTVTPAPLTISADNKSMTYGASVPQLTASYAGLVNGDTPATFSAAGNTSPALATVFASSHVGSYAITASGALDPDYTISYVAGTLTVTPAPLAITANNQSMVYGGVLPALTASYSGLVNGDSPSNLTIPPALATVPASSHVGTYSISAAGASDADYTISYAAGTLSITPAPLVITANDQTKVYGAALPTLTVSYSGFVNGDTSASLTTPPTLTTTATAASHVSGNSYTISASGAVDSDYTISYTAGSFTVTPAALTITADNQTMVYGGMFPTLTASYTGFVNGDNAASLSTLPALSTTATPSSHVAGSPYLITARGAADPDYTVSYVAGSLTVTPAPLTITARSQSMVYGGLLPPLTVTYTGLVNGDTPATFSEAGNAPPALSTVPANSPVGSYTIAVSGAVDPDYNISYLNGTLTIAQGGTITSLAAKSTGQTVALVAMVTAASGSGTPTGSIDFFDATTHTDLGSAPLTGGNARLTTGLLPPGNQAIIAAYGGDADFTVSNTSLAVSTAASVYVLNPSAAGALTLSGNADLIVPGIVDVDSSSTSAINASGNAQVSAGTIEVVGKVLSSGNAHLKATPTTGATAIADPLAQLPVPASDLPKQVMVNVGGNSSLTINPGIYSQINVSGNAKLTMNPGVYVITGGGFNVSGNAGVTGSGIMIYNAGSNFPGTGGTFGSVNLSGNGNVALTPMTTGVYAGILIFQSRDNTNSLSISGNAQTVTAGTIYAANAQVILSGNAHLQDSIVAGGLQLTGNAILNLGAPASGGSNAAFVTSSNLNLAAIEQLFAAKAAFLSQQVQAQARQEFSQGAVDTSLLDELFETWLALP